MTTHRYLHAELKEPSTSAVLVTNTSGGILSVAVWSITMVGQLLLASGATAVDTDIHIDIDGIVVAKMNLVTNTAGVVSTNNYVHDAGGYQFTLANGHTITLNQGVPAGCFTRSSCSMAVDMVSGS